MNRAIVLTLLGLGASIAGCSHPASNSSMQSTQATEIGSPQSSVAQNVSAVDLHNTICPVSGQAVGDSKVTEVYDGKVYHLCCDDCPKKFQQDPSKYASAVSADPSKYGIK